ncbi:enoyl-CoA hydratase/isomerase family protein [Actinacidiphila oryziradicis]|uniref:Enoyl-CoA hydratase/isomerase family protein n=2 Tax=Actinacidiphila oryziradicis TaxID=2571141 RepID=A0A4U0SK36_9ACTN|nr:enoyl-CoA hydratase/isomerase family protein [Actinacidiphila oryziradicis]
MISEPTAGDGTVPAAEPAVERRLDGKVAVLTMRHRPHNLLDPALSGYIIDAMAWAGTSGARAVLLRSGLRHFSAGADLDQMLAAADEGEGVIDWPLLETLRALEDLPLPIVAAVHGMCLGGGLELALACDLTVAGESAKIGCVEASVGLHPLMGAIQRIAQRAGVARAKEMAMLGRRYDARTLERWGIFNRRRLTLLGTAGAVLVIAAGAVSAVTMSAGRPGDTVQVEATGADRPCPAQLGPLNASQRPGAADAMVPASPVSAWVCLYERPSSPAPGRADAPVLTRSGRLSSAQVSALVASLDAAPKGAMRCVSNAHTVTDVRFAYPSGPDVEVRIGVDNCRNASNGSRDANATAVSVPVPPDAAQRGPAPSPSP